MNGRRQDLADGVAGADDSYGAALERWLALGGADLEERTAATLGDLGLTVGPETPMVGLSGGQAARVGLAALLLSRFDVLCWTSRRTISTWTDWRGSRVSSGAAVGTVMVSATTGSSSPACVTSVVELDLAQQQVGVLRRRLGGLPG